ncbi:MAG: hypothetical protein WKF75_03225 [Singulisphaera sp.]
MLAIPEIGRLHGVVIGRVDLSGSMGLSREQINSDKILELSLQVAEQAKAPANRWSSAAASRSTRGHSSRRSPRSPRPIRDPQGHLQLPRPVEPGGLPRGGRIRAALAQEQEGLLRRSIARTTSG